TGHLVFSTLHTNDAASAVTRLLDLGIEPYLVASSVMGVLAQRLVRRVCPDCAKPYKPNGAELAFLNASNGGTTEKMRMGAGCPLSPPGVPWRGSKCSALNEHGRLHLHSDRRDARGAERHHRRRHASTGARSPARPWPARPGSPRFHARARINPPLASSRDPP